MAKVSIAVKDHGDDTRRERPAENVLLEVVDAYYERFSREAATIDGKVIPARSGTNAVLEVVAPKSQEPTKVFFMELGCGKHLVPSEDRTYLDDQYCVKDRDRKLHPKSGWAVFTSSLAKAGAETGIYTAANEAAVTDNIKNLIGIQFHHSRADMNGGDDIGTYKASIATAIFHVPAANADLEAIAAELVRVCSTAPAVGYGPAEVVGKMNVTSAQRAMVNNFLANPEWVKANTGVLFGLTQTGRFIRLQP